MAITKRSAGRLKLIGGELCLDFANTVDWHASDHPREFLTSYADLVAWGQHVGILTAQEAEGLLREASRRPAEAEAALARAIALREAIYRIFSAVVTGARPAASDLDILNAALREALAHMRIDPTPDGFAWAWAEAEAALARVLWPVARSAGELLTSAALGRVRRCADQDCGWLFLDRSRNRSRRWCDMKDCGNRAKARRHYRQVKKSSRPDR